MRWQFGQAIRPTTASLIDARLFPFRPVECRRFGSCGIIFDSYGIFYLISSFSAS